MKIALCFSGHIRDINETKVFWKGLIKKYDMDVYASFWDVENEEVGDTINNFLTNYSPKKIDIEKYDVFKTSTQSIASLYVNPPTNLHPKFIETTKAFGQIAMWYKIWKCNMLSKDLGVEYDLVIRARTDIVLDENFKIEINDYLNVPMGYNNAGSLFPWSEGLNDCFGYGKPKVMDYYSFLYPSLMGYVNEGHYLFPPEHLLRVHMSKVHIQVRFFPTYMMITRVSKGTEHEVYNGFITIPYEEVIWSDVHDYQSNPDITYNKPIKDEIAFS
jgi:hypothetical protein